MFGLDRQRRFRPGRDDVGSLGCVCAAQGQGNDNSVPFQGKLLQADSVFL